VFVVVLIVSVSLDSIVHVFIVVQVLVVVSIFSVIFSSHVQFHDCTISDSIVQDIISQEPISHD
jgi:hypothetical protein